MSRTIVVGGGFVGLFTVLHLCYHKYPKSLFLIDGKDHFVFNPYYSLIEVVTTLPCLEIRRRRRVRKTPN